MKSLAVAIASVGLFGLALSPQLSADQWDKKTIITVNEPIQVPNKVLPPGKYVLKLLDSPSDRHIVQIFNADESQIQTTILAIPNYRLEPTGETRLQFWETPPGQPKALRAWFYPGDNFGQEFAYPKNAATQIAEFAKTPVPTTTAQTPTEMNTAPVTTTAPEVAQNEPAPAPAPEPAPAPAPEPSPAPQEPPPAPAPAALPQTASPFPLIGLFGLLSLAGYGVLRSVRGS